MKSRTLLLASLVLPATLVAGAGLAAAEVNQPTEIIDRPRTLPAKEIELGGDLLIGLTDPTVTALQLGVGYGIDPKLELRVNYGFGLDPSTDGKGPLSVAGGYSLGSAGSLTMAAEAELGYDVSGEHLAPFAAGVELQYKLNKQMGLYSEGRQLVLGLVDEDKAKYVQAPIAFVYQASHNVFASAGTNVLQLELADSSTGFLFADFLPLALTGTYSLGNTIDLSAGLSWGDLKADEAIQHPTLSLGARLYL